MKKKLSQTQVRRDVQQAIPDVGDDELKLLCSVLADASFTASIKQGLQDLRDKAYVPYKRRTPKSEGRNRRSA